MANESTSVVAYRKAVAAVGSHTAFAKLIGQSQQAVSKRLKKGLPLQPEYVLIVAAATGIPKEQLRPDIYGLPESAPPPTDRYNGARA